MFDTKRCYNNEKSTGRSSEGKAMLKLTGIIKDYKSGDSFVRALDQVSLCFRRSEFVSILGPSGCGKTTLLNIIGGLDRYSAGELYIDGRPTSSYRDADWDAYRNHTVGFVFQSYNLIPHLSVRENVEMALTLSGVSKSERRRRAEEAVAKVGLSAQADKRPNQLSGGQMQRVAIARALVNDPQIILADEPTGALDSVTSVQVMELLREIAADRLVIMVTHNRELAERYSTRIVTLLDGKVQSDSNPFAEGVINLGEPVKLKRTSMALWTALSLSFKNLTTKKARTVLTAFAGSIGIVGIALVLALSNGLTSFLNTMQREMLTNYPLQINQTAYNYDMESMFDQFLGGSGSDEEKFPDEQEITAYETTQSSLYHTNVIDQQLVDYVEQIDPTLITAIQYGRQLRTNLVTLNDQGQYVSVSTSGVNWSEMLNNLTFMEKQYDVLTGHLPTAEDEVALVVNQYNQLSVAMLGRLGITAEDGEKISFDRLMQLRYKVIFPDDYYIYSPELGYYGANSDYEGMYNDPDSLEIRVVGIIRLGEASSLQLYGNGLVYSPALTERLLAEGAASDVAAAQKASPDKSIFINTPDIDAAGLESLLQQLGASSLPTSIYIYPASFEDKAAIKSYLDSYNVILGAQEREDTLMVTDMAEMMTDSVGMMINIISYVLIAFAAISPVVSSIMIGIITYVSVIERTKEIGVLRSIGARKRDISRVFDAETLIVGFTAGVIGVLFALILTVPVNAIVSSLASFAGTVAVLNPLHAVLLVVISMVLTLISGLIPAGVAAKKDPVVALRTE